jgi:hypothetical protein
VLDRMKSGYGAAPNAAVLGYDLLRRATAPHRDTLELASMRGRRQRTMLHGCMKLETANILAPMEDVGLPSGITDTVVTCALAGEASAVGVIGC